MSSSSKTLASWPSKVRNALHFTTWSNFILFIITVGALMGFTLARFMFLNIDHIFCNPTAPSVGAAPGECYYYSGASGTQRYRIGIILHLGTILPAAFLVCFQFVPVIRHKLTLFHRVNGYIVLLLCIISSVGVYMIADKAFGGAPTVQVVNGLAATMFLGALIIAYFNIKRGRIDLHRAWMLRAWSYASSIITLRLIMLMESDIKGAQKGFTARPCSQISYIVGNAENITLLLYPECQPFFDGTNLDQHALVAAKMGENPVEIAAFLGMAFGVAFEVALPLHAFLVEVYLHFTAGESERLRQVSMERREQAGKQQVA